MHGFGDCQCISEVRFVVFSVIPLFNISTVNTFFREGEKRMKKVRLAMSARHTVRGIDGKPKRIKKKT